MFLMFYWKTLNPILEKYVLQKSTLYFKNGQFKNVQNEIPRISFPKPFFEKRVVSIMQ